MNCKTLKISVYNPFSLNVLRRLISPILLLALILTLGNPGVYAVAPTPTPSDLAQTQAAIAAAKQRQQSLDMIRQKLGMNIASALSAQEELRKSLELNRIQQAETQADIKKRDSEIAELQAKIAFLAAEIIKTQQRIDQERSQLKSLARDMYTRPDSLLLSLAEAENIDVFLTQVSALSLASDRARQIKIELVASALQLESDKKQKVDAEAKVEVDRAALADKLQKLVALQNQQEKVINDLSLKVEQSKNELVNAQQQSTDLAQRISDLIVLQQQEIIASGMSSVWSQAVAANPGGPIAISVGHSVKYRFVWPENGVETQPFGPSTLGLEPPYGGYPHFHTGIDIGAPANTPVVAVDDGIVILAGASTVNGQLVGYGNYIIIAHNGGLDTLYGHLNYVGVKVGDAVIQGQAIGLEGSTGNSTGPHIHFELRTNGIPQDPRPYLAPGDPSTTKV